MENRKEPFIFRPENFGFFLVGLYGLFGLGLYFVAWASSFSPSSIAAAAQERIAASAAAAQTITKEELTDNVRLLSHEVMGGRSTLNKTHELAAFFLARELREYGALPLGEWDVPMENREYFQSFKPSDGVRQFDGRKLWSRNVIGYFPADSDEWLIIGAHSDHVGMGEFGSRTNARGTLHPGADDNASGTSAVLEIAEAIGDLRRRGQGFKRNILIGFWGAEEMGCLGSEHFVTNLPSEVKKEKIVAVINLDMVGRNEDAKLWVIGTSWKRTLKEACPELHTLVETANKREDLRFTLNYQDSADKDSFNRSDQESFFKARPAGNRIPVLFFHTGEHPDYHTPTDTWEKINYPKLARVSKLALHVLWELANSGLTPKYVD